MFGFIRIKRRTKRLNKNMKKLQKITDSYGTQTLDFIGDMERAGLNEWLDITYLNFGGEDKVQLYGITTLIDTP